MSLISLDLNQARQTAQTFSSSDDTLDDLRGRLQQQWSALAASWEGNSKYDVASDVQAVLNWEQHCSQFTHERSTKLNAIADRFQAADENEPFAVPLVPWGLTNLADALFGASHDLLAWAGDIENLLAIPAALSLTFTAGGSYPGQLIVKGSHALNFLGYDGKGLKDLAGLSENLTHIAAGNLPAHMAAQAAHLTPLSVLLTAGPQWIEDIQEYQDDGLAQLGSALVVDGVLTVGLSAGASYLGTYAGAALGQMLIPIPGVGAVIGGAVGNLVGDWVADEAFDLLDQTGVRDTLIDGATGVVNTVAQTAEQAFSSTVKAIQDIPWPQLPEIKLPWE